MEPTNSSRSPMVDRGWLGSGSMADRGIIFPTGVSCLPASSSTKWVSCRILTCMGRPPRFFETSDTAQDLFRETVVLEGAGGLRGEGEDRLPVGGALLQTHALGDHGFKHLNPEDALDLLVDVLGE